MGAPFINRDDASQRLFSSIVTYKGQPVFVSEPGVSRTNHVTIKYLQTQATESVCYTDNDFDYNNLEVGYFISENSGTYHMCRRPARLNFVGLRMDSLDTAIRSADFYGLPMYNCIMGITPTFKEAIKGIRTNYNDGIFPFSRHAAVVKNDPFNWKIKYMNIEVALVDKHGVVTPLKNYSGDYSCLLKKLGVL